MPDPLMLITELIKSRKGKWVRRLNALTTSLIALKEQYDDDDPAVVAAEKALIRHFDKLHD